MSDLEFRISELERRLANVIRYGTVETLDETAARVTVRCGDILTAPLPWLTRRAGPDRDWWAPEPGEQVLVLSPSGDPAQGAVLPAIYQDAYPAPAASKTVRRIQFADGTVIDYDRAAHLLKASVAGGSIEASADVSAKVTSPEVTAVASAKVSLQTPLVECSGNLAVAGNGAFGGGLTMTGANGSGDITTPGNVTDGVRSMAGDRAIYNGHTHNDPQGGTIPAPNQQQ